MAGDHGGRRVPRLGVVWLTAIVAFVLVSWLMALAMSLADPLLALPALLAPGAMFFVAASLTPGLSPLTSTVPRRIGWAALVTLGGTLGTLFLLAAVEGSGVPWLVVPLVGLPFTLVAAMLAPGVATRLGAVAVTAVLLPAGVALPERTTAEDAELRLSAVNALGGVLIVSPEQSWRQPPVLRPAAEGFGLRYGSDATEWSAEPVAMSLRQSPARGDEPDLVYRGHRPEHTYERRVGRVLVTVTLSGEVGRATADEIAYRLRMATDEEVLRLLPPVPDPGPVTLDRFARSVSALLGDG